MEDYTQIIEVISHSFCSGMMDVGSTMHLISHILQ